MLEVAIGGLAAPAVASVIGGAMPADHVRASAAAADWRPSLRLTGLDAILPRREPG
jgi:hypothetical protein